MAGLHCGSPCPPAWGHGEVVWIASGVLFFLIASISFIIRLRAGGGDRLE